MARPAPPRSSTVATRRTTAAGRTPSASDKPVRQGRAEAPAARRPLPRAKVDQILDALYGQHPGAFTELDFRNPFELLVATILSAQSTDRRVNQVTPALFARYPDARALAAATTAELEPQIKATGFFRMKAKAIQGMAQALVEQHRGEVPASMDALTALPGVGRKTANVVLGHALGVPGLPVDRHVLRVANRLRLASAATPEQVETQLCRVVPRERWTLASDTLILHGRRVCRPRPLCPRCAAVTLCEFARRFGAADPAAKPAAAMAAPPHRRAPDGHSRGKARRG
jgi:endonuclease-3